jgi:hypothetical protein
MTIHPRCPDYVIISLSHHQIHARVLLELLIRESIRLSKIRTYRLPCRYLHN